MLNIFQKAEGDKKKTKTKKGHNYVRNNKKVALKKVK